MLDIPVKSDGVSTLPAATFNSMVDELEKIITSTGATLSGGSTQQIAEAMAAYAAVGQYYSEAGAADAYVCSVAPVTRLAPDSYYTGMVVTFVPANANTGASTINVASLGSKSIKKADGTTALSAGDIKTEGLTVLWYDGTNFLLQSSGSIEITESLAITGSYKNKVIAPNSSNPNYQVDIDADAIILENASSKKYAATSVNLTVDITASGANGLDGGSEAGNTWYFLWVIYNGTTVAGLLSTSSSAPTMPSGYTYKALVGAVRNDGSSNFVNFTQSGDVYTYVQGQSAYSGASATWVAVDTAPFVPAALSDRAFGTGVSNTSGSLSIANDNSVNVDLTTAKDKNKVANTAAASVYLPFYWAFTILTANTIYAGNNSYGGDVFVDGFIVNKLG